MDFPRPKTQGAVNPSFGISLTCPIKGCYFCECLRHVQMQEEQWSLLDGNGTRCSCDQTHSNIVFKLKLCGHSGKRYAFWFYGMSWRGFECVFGLMTSSGQPIQCLSFLDRFSSKAKTSDRWKAWARNPNQERYRTHATAGASPRLRYLLPQ